MRLALSSNCITITISEHSHSFQEITTSLSKFKKSFWINNTLINLATSKETWERKKFLLELYKKCSLNAKKHNGHFLKKLLDAHTKPIKVMITDTTSPIKRVCVSLKVIEKSLHVNFEKDEKFMFWYFVNYFKKYNPKHDVQKKNIVIKTISEELKDIVFNLISKDNILGTHMLYMYSKFELNTLFYKNKSYEYANNTIEVASLSWSYELLKVNKTDSLEVIRKKYLRLAKRYHPDHQSTLNGDEKKKNLAIFHKIQTAYETIKSHKKIAA